jgi:hypothetical protein
MKYSEELRLMMTYFPRSNLTEEDVLHHLFFVNGNGYEWVNGELVCYRSEEEAKAHYDDFVAKDIEKSKEYADRYGDEAAWRYYGDTPEETKEKELAYRKSFAKPLGEGNKEDCWFILPDGRMGHYMYPISQYAKILHVPDDVKPDWLEAAFRAIEMAESDLCICTDKDKEWLEKAKKKLARFKTC